MRLWRGSTECFVWQRIQRAGAFVTWVHYKVLGLKERIRCWSPQNVVQNRLSQVHSGVCEASVVLLRGARPGPHVTPDPVDQEQHLRELVLPERPVRLNDQEWTRRPQCGFLLCKALTVGPRVAQGAGGIRCR